MQELPNALKAEVRLSALDRTDVSTIYVGAVREGLLRDIQLFAPFP